METDRRRRLALTAMPGSGGWRSLVLLLSLSLGCRFDPSGLGAQDLFVGDQIASDRGVVLDAAGDAADLGGRDAPVPRDLLALETPVADTSNDTGADGSKPDLGSGDPLAPFGAPTALTQLNTTAGEDDPTLTGDMLEIYFNRGADIYCATRALLSDPWSAPKQVPLLSSASDETNPELTPDGLTIFFASNRPHPQAKGDYDIYVSTRSQRGQSWSTPTPVASLNTSASDHPAPAPDLLTMVVLSNRPGSLGAHDLYLSTRGATSAAWGAPAPITSLNTSTQESSAWLDASTLLLYYASSRQAANHDIWLSSRTAPGQPFGQPVNMASLNSTASDEDPWLSPDLRTDYFSSTRNGQNDLFVAMR